MAGSDVTPIQPGAIDAMVRRLESIEQWQREMMPSVAQSVTDIVVALVLRPGVIVEYGSTTAPSGFLLCDGTQYPQATYPNLYAVIGASFNTGGETAGYFRVPDRRGRVGVGYDPSQAEFNTVGETGGAKTHTLTGAENGAHNHTQDAHSHGFSPGTHYHSGGADFSSFNGLASGTNYPIPTPATTNGNSTFVSASVNSATATNQDSGSGAPHNNLQPYIALPYIIKF